MNTGAVLEAIPAAAYCCDPDGLIVRVNRRVVALWGRSPRLNDPGERFTGAHRLFGPDGAPLAIENCWMAHALRERRPFDDRRVTVERPDGSRSVVANHVTPLHDATGRLTGAVNVLVELPGRLAADGGSRAEGERLALLLDGVGDAAICLLGIDGRILTWNAGAQAISGFTREQMVGQELAVLLAGPAEAAERLLARARAESRTESEGWHRCADGTRFRAHRVVSALTGPDGLPAGFCLVVRDITEKRALETLLLESQKLEAIGRLTGGIAHDFNNLLAVILGSLELAHDRTGFDGDTRALLREAAAAGERAKRINGSLLAFSRRQALQPETLDPGQVIAQAATLLGRMLGDTVAIEIALDVPLWSIDVDRAQLETALVNLAVNARDAMPDGGRLRFSARNQPAVAGLDGTAADHVALEIIDTGVGMAPETLSRAFEPFFTTKPPGTGTGLGLAMVYGFIRQSGGHCRIHSAPGQGTTVQLLFPRASDAAAAAAPAPATTVPARTGPVAERSGPARSVLLVEDVDGLRRLLSRQLRGLGFTVTAVADADAALAALEAGQPPDLLLTDIVMPGAIDGAALARQVRARFPGTRTLLMTGYAAAERAAGEELVPLLRKPFNRDELAAAVDAALAGMPAARPQP